jgi:hypothetical protein
MARALAAPMFAGSGQWVTRDRVWFDSTRAVNCQARRHDFDRCRSDVLRGHGGSDGTERASSRAGCGRAIHGHGRALLRRKLPGDAARLPSGWHIEVVETLASDDRTAAQVRVDLGDEVFWCAGFYTCATAGSSTASNIGSQQTPRHHRHGASPLRPIRSTDGTPGDRGRVTTTRVRARLRRALISLGEVACFDLLACGRSRP